MPAWYYEQIDLGYNYRMSDLQAALGVSQLARIDSFLAKRRQLAKEYEELLDKSIITLPVADTDGYESSWHLYQVQVPHRDEIYNTLRSKGVGAQIHYLPIYRHPYYQKLKYNELLEGAEYFYQHTLTIPLHPKINRVDQSMISSIIAAALDKIGS